MGIRLGVIGGGNMGRAIVRGAIEGDVLAPDNVLVVDVDPAKRLEVASLGCHVAEWPGAAVEWASEGELGQVMLAVKPQAFPEVAQALAPVMPSRMIVISIMAGRSSAAIRIALGGEAKVIRVMPNTPCMVGAGMSAIAIGAGANPEDTEFAKRLFGTIGRTIDVAESLMHAVTAVSGSGPAYVFLLAEAMERAAQDMGLPSDAARLLVSQTLLGASRLLDDAEATGGTAEELRHAVTSPGGTTAAALDVMMRHGLPETIIEAMIAARDRGHELDG
ncbi:MAG TPA: pyrroline-5-carboxylate reductase [Phycisphaerales bacterium]|nr:pyrroline-5-carboxylate reductase [Phycisphaerales bacterium]HRQ76797.1 pyrroline-5-carboxylate reductase [Phycisphaerales bacterium]